MLAFFGKLIATLRGDADGMVRQRILDNARTDEIFQAAGHAAKLVRFELRQIDKHISFEDSVGDDVNIIALVMI